MEETKTNASQGAPKEAEVVGRKFDEKDIAENKYVAMLSYLGILCLVPLLVKKESPFAQFHARQGLVIAIAWVIGWVFFWVPLFGQLAALVLFVVNVVALIKTYAGEAWEIPVVTDVAKKLNI